MYESTGWSTHANSGAIYLKSAPICVTFKSLPDIKSSVWLQENWSRLGNPAGLVDSVADFFVGAAAGAANQAIGHRCHWLAWAFGPASCVPRVNAALAHRAEFI